MPEKFGRGGLPSEFFEKKFGGESSPLRFSDKV
jgi:hypothetical protein